MYIILQLHLHWRLKIILTFILSCSLWLLHNQSTLWPLFSMVFTMELQTLHTQLILWCVSMNFSVTLSFPPDPVYESERCLQTCEIFSWIWFGLNLVSQRPNKPGEFICIWNSVSKPNGRSLQKRWKMQEKAVYVAHRNKTWIQWPKFSGSWNPDLFKSEFCDLLWCQVLGGEDQRTWHHIGGK